MKRTLALIALGVVLGVFSRWSTSPLNPLPQSSTPEAWPLD